MIDETGKTVYNYKPGKLERVKYSLIRLVANIDAAIWKRRHYRA